MASSNCSQGDAASYSSNFSFDPGSVKTTSAFSKRPRFASTQVPGTSKGVSGDRGSIMRSSSKRDSLAVESRQQAFITARGTERKGKILLQNASGFTSEKASELRRFLQEDGDEGWMVVLLTEVNVDWRESYESLKAMTHWSKQRHVHYAHNTWERNYRLFQPGGVAMISFGQAAAKVLSTERDESGLGRWCSVQYQLKGSRLWVIVAYRPCISLGPDTVSQQHIRRLRGS